MAFPVIVTYYVYRELPNFKCSLFPFNKLQVTTIFLRLRKPNFAYHKNDIIREVYIYLTLDMNSLFSFYILYSVSSIICITTKNKKRKWMKNS